MSRINTCLLCNQTALKTLQNRKPESIYAVLPLEINRAGLLSYQYLSVVWILGLILLLQVQVTSSPLFRLGIT